MAIPKPREKREPRHADKRSETIQVRRWWTAFAMEWAWIAVSPKVRQLLVERGRAMRLWSYRSQLVDALDAVVKMRGRLNSVADSLAGEIGRVERECEAFTPKHAGLPSYRETALYEDDTIEKVARTLLLEHGFKPWNLRRKADRNRTTERKATALRKKYRAELRMLRELRAEVAAGAGYRAGGQPLTEARIDSEIAILESKLSGLGD